MEDKEKITEVELMRLENLQMGKLLAVANAEKALAENNLAEVRHQNYILQLYFKYSLKETDSIESDGTITRKDK